MKKFKATILWPYVFFLDWLISLTGTQSFKESRRISQMHYNRIINGAKSMDILNEAAQQLPQNLDPAKKPYFSRNSE